MSNIAKLKKKAAELEARKQYDKALDVYEQVLNSARASEAIGECFMDKGNAGVTMTVLERLVHESAMSDGRLVGVLYLLGHAAESLGRSADAAGYFQRVLAVQIGFRDASGRLASLARASK